MLVKHYKDLNNLAKLIDGNLISKQLKEKLKLDVAKFKNSYGYAPGLAIVQVGDRTDSNVYIKMKLKSAEEIGMTANLIKIAKSSSQKEILSIVKQLNSDQLVHGIIIQLPLDTDEKIDSNFLLSHISIHKDVDGLHPYNSGQLSHGDLSNTFIPCTPNGCLHLIKSTGCSIEGKRAVVVGRSRIVGSPMAQLLIWNNATVTVCHSKTQNLSNITKEADILVAAIGKAHFIKGDWIKPGAIVIDCGINSIPDETKKSGYRLVGDVDIEQAAQNAEWITPVPGGVGPMTVCMLLNNTVESAFRHMNKSQDCDAHVNNANGHYKNGAENEGTIKNGTTGDYKSISNNQLI